MHRILAEFIRILSNSCFLFEYWNFWDFTASVATRFHISKYPTLKIIRNGQPTKREYRGQRSVDAFVEYVKKLLEDPIQEFQDLQALPVLDDKKRMMIGFFDSKDVPEYETFRRVATNLKDDCQFHVGFGYAFSNDSSFL